MFINFDPTTSLLAGQSTATLQQWLADAQLALHELSIGRRVQASGYDGKSVTLTPSNIGQVENWITQLQRQLGMQIRRHALRPIFR